MKIIKTNILAADVMMMTLYPFLLLNRKYEKKVTKKDFFHEKIHARQQKEMLLIFFYLWYLIEFLVRFIAYKGDANKAYFNISFEKEAYTNETDFDFLKHRNFWNFLKFI